ncbi:MAG: oxidoreductase [Gammaproteobacteria bacterium]
MKLAGRQTNINIDGLAMQLNSGSDSIDSSFFVVAHEPGAEHPALPTWANRTPNPAKLSDEPGAVTCNPVETVPGAFQLLNLLSADECAALVTLTEKMGYLPDAAVSLPRSVRHNDNVTWVVDTSTVEHLWSRCAIAFENLNDPNIDKPAVGLNARFRFYRYKEGDFFAPHTDGAWFGSAVINDQLETDAFGDRYSQYSLVIFLSDGFRGGRTEFYVDGSNSRGSSASVPVATPLGAGICFPHGGHPWHCVHSSETITEGVKYIIRTDVLFKL